MELASTISYSDSIPLLAFIFKAILPHDISKFQYFGLWLFTCIFFQLYIAFLILYKMTRDVHLALLGSIFFVILPTFLLRTDVHFALAAHFLVLAALFLGYYGEISSKFCSWILLGVSSVLIHPYFTIIIIVFYFSFWVIHCLQHKFYFRLMGEALCFLLAVVLACYVIGLFELNFPSLEGRGLGAHTSSLIKLLIPLEDSSLFIPVPMYQFTSYEGLAYFGVGLMVLIFISLVNIRLVKLRARDLSLLLCALISLFLSSYPYTPLYPVVEYQFQPSIIDNLMAIFRANGRFIWPIVYITIVMSLVLIAKWSNQWLRIGFVGGCLVIQLFDVSPQIAAIHADRKVEAFRLYEALRSSDFHEREIDAIRSIPKRPFPKGWQQVSRYAVEQNMDSELVYLARWTSVAHKYFSNASQEMDYLVRNNEYELNTVYVIEPGKENFVLENIDKSFVCSEWLAGFLFVSRTSDSKRCYSK